MIDIILPVYNALDEVKACLASVCRHTPATLARVVLIDDASTDPRVQAWLAELPRPATGPAIEVLRNPHNLGFVGSVNRGMQMGAHDVVLLNSDTVVTAGWLERMQACADSRPDVATVTPFSNNAEICSYPAFCAPTRVGALELGALVQALADCDDGTYPQLPTAVGFCMLIRRHVLRQIGFFDAVRFGRGYGEENEFCLRASAAGFVHLLCSSALVLHHGGRSFGQDTQGLRQAHLQVLLDLYPGYTQLVADFVARDPVAPWRERVMQRLQAQGLDALGQAPRPAVLMITHAWGGGVEKHVQDLQDLLAQDLRIEILRPVADNVLQLQDGQGNSLLFDAAHWAALVQVLRERAYQRVHLHHWQGHPPDTLQIATDLGLPLDVTVHDFAPVCPQFNLSGPQGTTYCGEPALADCERCVQTRPHPWGLTVAQWRAQMGRLLEGAARVWAPSAFVAQRLARHWPQLPVQVWPHPPRQDWLAWLDADAAGRSGPRKVLVLGGLSVTKGLHRVRDAAALASTGAQPLHFVLAGYTGEPLPQWPALPLTVTGQYQDADLPALLQLQNADLIWFPSEIPETWSYTLDIALASGLPIACGEDAGALAERLRAWGAPHRVLASQAGAGDINRALLEMTGDTPTGNAFMASAVSTPGSDRTPAQQPLTHRTQREHYRQRLLAQYPSAGTATALPLVLQTHPQPPTLAQESARLSLSVLFDHGVLCGHDASRRSLQVRLREADRLVQDLQDLAIREGAPWYELVTQWQARNQQLALHARAVQEALDERTAAHEALQQDAAALEARLAQLQARLQLAIATYENSRSWRWTAPLRHAGQWLRRASPGLVHVIKTVRRGWQRRHMALQILREQGLVMLLRRAWAKLQRPQAPRLAVIPNNPGLEAIAPLNLETCGPNQRPLVSIVIPVYGQHLYTFNCLRSLGLHTDLRQVEIIGVDDCSPEPAEPVLRAVRGVQWLRNDANLGFIGSCNAGAARARGEYLLLLNNDVQVTAGWLHALLRVFALRPDAGMAGARLVYPDGTLQEAGGVLWRDGSAWNWGRGQDPEHPAYKYLREADYCSGACLMLRLSDWQALGGFDTAFAPAYYEDTDLAFRLRAMGKQVLYQPDATVVHYEGITSGTDETQGVKKHQVINQKTFFARWQATLAAHRPNGVEPWREVNRQARQHVLVIEACMITPDMDSGSVRMQALLEILTGMGVHVTFVADNLEYRQPYVQQLQQAGIEVWYAPYIASVAELIERTGSRYDAVMICRHYIARPLVNLVRRHAPQARLWFDTVDLHYLREERLAALEHSPQIAATAAQTRVQELGVIRDSDITFVVSPVEQGILAREAPGSRIEILSNIHEPLEQTPGHAEREGLLFVGGFQHPPNVDAVHWFVREVWPLVRARLPELQVRIVGSKMPENLRELAGNGVEVLGFVQDIDPLLASSRISIAPLRYGAGVKGKVNQAMSHGLPVVATSMAVEGMDLIEGAHVLVGDTPEDFAQAVLRLYNDPGLWQRLVEGGKANVRQVFSREVVRQTLHRLLTAPAAAGADPRL
jgi:GT2 family glycosyltransferase/glycosyltransferase involved in cell wall biosynthesis